MVGECERASAQSPNPGGSPAQKTYDCTPFKLRTAANLEALGNDGNDGDEEDDNESPTGAGSPNMTAGNMM